MTSIGRWLAAGMAAAALSGCATAPADAPAASTDDCAVLMLAAGFIAEHQPPLQLAGRTSDVERAMGRRRIPLRAEVPETYSPDADAAMKSALAAARLARRAPPLRIACPLKGPSPFVGWRPGRARLLLSNPAIVPDHSFAVLDAAVVLPGVRTDYYRFMFDGPRWDIHRLEFDSQPAGSP